VLEAMACGVPMIATRAGSLPGVIEDESTGLLVAPADPATPAYAMVEIWNCPDRRDRMGQLGQRCV